MKFFLTNRNIPSSLYYSNALLSRRMTRKITKCDVRALCCVLFTRNKSTKAGKRDPWWENGKWHIGLQLSICRTVSPKRQYTRKRRRTRNNSPIHTTTRHGLRPVDCEYKALESFSLPPPRGNHSPSSHATSSTGFNPFEPLAVSSAMQKRR